MRKNIFLKFSDLSKEIKGGKKNLNDILPKLFPDYDHDSIYFYTFPEFWELWRVSQKISLPIKQLMIDVIDEKYWISELFEIDGEVFIFSLIKQGIGSEARAKIIAHFFKLDREKGKIKLVKKFEYSSRYLSVFLSYFRVENEGKFCDSDIIMKRGFFLVGKNYGRGHYLILFVDFSEFDVKYVGKIVKGILGLKYLTGGYLKFYEKDKKWVIKLRNNFS